MMNSMRTALPLVVFAALLVPISVGAQVAPGTQLSGNLTQTLDTKNVQVGQPVTLTNVASTDGSGRIAGATLYGHVVEVNRAGQGKRPQLLITFERLVTPKHRYSIEARVLSMKEQTKSNALREVGGAVVGNIVGNILGKGLGTNAGGLLGAGGGFLYAKNYRENFSVPGGSAVTVEVVRSRRQA
jgi:outer membrane lipoprotein SlyB